MLAITQLAYFRRIFLLEHKRKTYKMQRFLDVLGANLGCQMLRF